MHLLVLRIAGLRAFVPLPSHNGSIQNRWEAPHPSLFVSSRISVRSLLLYPQPGNENERKRNRFS